MNQINCSLSLIQLFNKTLQINTKFELKNNKIKTKFKVRILKKL